MRIAILSDFHLGYDRFREDAFRQAQEALARAASGADALIIPGDIFDNRTPKPDVIAEAINLFRDLSKRTWGAKVTGFEGKGQHYTDIPIIAIPGTHERRAQDAADPVGLLGLAGLIVGISNATVMLEKDGERVAVVGIGGIADERFKQVVAESDPRPVEGAFSIFMFHESVYELLPFNESFIKQDELPAGFDLYVCGHIHNSVDSQVHGKKFLIPGSTVLTQLKAGEQEKKGLYIYDTKTSTYEFIGIESRRFVLVKVKMGADTTALEGVEREMEKAIGSSGDRPIVRVVVEGDSTSPRIGMELGMLQKKYQDKAVVEVSGPGISSTAKSVNADTEAPKFENMSIKDYGMGVFIEKLRQKGVSFGKVGPADLFDALSLEGSKDKAIRKALDMLL